MSEYERFMAWIVRTYPTHARAYSGDPVIQSAFFAGLAEDRRMRFLEARDGRSKDGGLEMALAQAALDALAAERDGLMQTLRDEMDENLRLRELGGALPDENITAMTERLIRERDALRAVTARMVAGIDHLDKLTREWEPDHSSGADRRGWLLAKDARDDAVLALRPNVMVSGPPRRVRST